MTDYGDDQTALIMAVLVRRVSKITHTDGTQISKQAMSSHVTNGLHTTTQTKPLVSISKKSRLYEQTDGCARSPLRFFFLQY